MAQAMCSVEECARMAEHCGWCGMHYQRWRIHGRMELVPRRRAEPRFCYIEGCTRPGRVKRGMCPVHYNRWQHHGDPVLVPPPRRHRRAEDDVGRLRCTRCSEWLPPEVFRIDKRGYRSSWCNPCKQAFTQAWRLANPVDRAQKRTSALLRRYGMTTADFERISRGQGDVCAICCEVPISNSIEGRLHVDHDHTTGAFRGLLCQNCNRGLGMFRDNPGFLITAAAYLTQRESP